MIAGCVDTTFRKLSGVDTMGAAASFPTTTDTADHICRDWSNVFRNSRDLLKVTPGPISNQRLEGIRNYIRNLDSIGLTRVFGQTTVDSGLMVDMTCNECMQDMKSRSKLRKCILCCKQYCMSCLSIQTVLIPSFKPFSDVSSCKTCARYLLRLQLDLDPWYNCASSSRELFEMEAKITDEHTQLCARLSNFEGLVRFFVENKDRIPRADMIGPLPEIENSIRSGISNLTSLQRHINQIQCVPHHRDEQIRKCLSNFVAYHIARIKSQFGVSSKLYERLMNIRGFSPASSPSSPPLRFNPSIGPSLDLDSL